MSEFESSLSLFKGTFNVPTYSFQEKVQNVTSILFDWDGVFNQGTKGGVIQSGFSEPDAMGINMMRFAYWLANDKQLPFIGIITGENNPSAQDLGNREHFNAVYVGIGNKVNALNHLKLNFSIEKERVAFCFDDVLDLGLAKLVGLRFLVNREANPIFLQHVKQKALCDYITYCSGGYGAIREITEVFSIALGQFYQSITLRSEFSELYKEYLSHRNNVKTIFFSQNDVKT